MSVDASLTLVMAMVTVPAAEVLVPSEAATESVKLGLVSKSMALAVATVMTPVVGSMAKASPVLPPVMVQLESVVLASGSAAVAVPTLVLSALFSARVKTLGVSEARARP